MALALEADPGLTLRAIAMITGRCESCRHPGRALTVLVDDADGARFEVCDLCLDT